MRSRKEIESGYDISIRIELLLDIRELLLEIKNERRKTMV